MCSGDTGGYVGLFASRLQGDYAPWLCEGRASQMIYEARTAGRGRQPTAAAEGPDGVKLKQR